MVPIGSAIMLLIITTPTINVPGVEGSLEQGLVPLHVQNRSLTETFHHISGVCIIQNNMVVDGEEK